MDACGVTCTDAHRSVFTDKQTHESTRRDTCRSTCTDAYGACTDISTSILRVNESTCPYISSEGISVHGFTSTDYSTVNMVVRGRTNAYDVYVRYKPKREISTDVVENVLEVGTLCGCPT